MKSIDSIPCSTREPMNWFLHAARAGMAIALETQYKNGSSLDSSTSMSIPRALGLFRHERVALPWIPAGPEEIVGNDEAKATIYEALDASREDTSGEHRNLQPLCFTGPNRSGKEACVFALVQSLCCQNATKPNWIPCKKCLRCSRLMLLRCYCEFAIMRRADQLIYWQIDCLTLTFDKLSTIEQTLKKTVNRIPKVVYLDEIHLLQGRGLDEQIQHLVRSTRHDTQWLARTPLPGMLDLTTGSLFKVVATSAPSVEELEGFIDRQCLLLGIQYDSCQTVRLMAETLQHEPGRCFDILTELTILGYTNLSREILEKTVLNYF